METSNELIVWLQGFGVAETYVVWILRIGVVMAFLALAMIADKICKALVIPTLQKIASKTQSIWDDHLFSENVLKNAVRLVTPIITLLFIPLLFSNDPSAAGFFSKCCWIYITVVAVMLSCSVVSAIYTVTTEHESYKNRSLKGFYQMIKLVFVCIGAIIVISTLLDKDPVAILTGLGAGTAILMLVFQDTIKGLVAGIQLLANDMLRPGDWISMPKYGADGDVLEVTLTSVKVQNWDKTITLVPPYALVNDSFQNWRGMFDTGGRRVKRSIDIDMNSVRFCTREEMAKFMEQPWMQGFDADGKEVANLQIFRQYVDYYLRNHPEVNTDLILLVRQLQPTAHGIPIELYFFSADTRWIHYEKLQAEVFEHVLAVLHNFDLRVFQSPSGLDIQKLN